MDTDAPISDRVRFEHFELRTRAGELRTQGRTIHLQDQPLHVLLVLLEHPGELVSREELHKKLWPGQSFGDFEDSLNHAVRRLRDALGDSAEHPRFIETVPRRGYKFIAPVHFLEVNQHRSQDGEPGPNRAIPRWVVAAAMLAMFLAGIVIARIVRQRPSPVPQLKQRQLTFNSRENGVNQGVISPDGKYLAYGDQIGMHLKVIETGETRDLPQPSGPASVPTPSGWWPNAWWPDGTSFLAVGDVDGRLSTWVVPLRGGPPRKLRDDADGWSVSPDGGLIAFGTGDSNVSVGHMFIPREIWLMTARGEQARPVVRAAEGEGFFWVAWAPDGRTILYNRYHLGSHGMECSIERCDAAGGQAAVVVSGTDLCHRLQHLWLSDGRLIYSVVRAESNTGESDLWSIKLDSTASPLTSPVRITDWAGGSLAPLGATKDGRRLTVLRRTAQADVSIAALRAADGAMGPSRRLTLDENNDYPGAWTADSKAVLFVTDRNGSLDIFQQGIDGQGPEPVVSGPDYKWSPGVTPDGAWILYLSQVAEQSGVPMTRRTFATPGPVRVMRAPVTGGPPQVILEARGLQGVTCARSPAALCVLAEQSADQKQALFSAFTAAQGRREELLRADLSGSGSLWSWDLSPDGSRIAFAEFNPREARIRIVPVANGVARDIVLKRLAGLSSVRWTADGESLLVTPNPASGTALLRVDMTGATEMLWDQTDVGGPYRSLGLQSPDGRHLAIQSWTGEYTLWMLENF